MIWTKKASLVKRGCENQIPQWQGGQRWFIVSRRGGGGSPPRRLVLRRVASPRSYPKSVRHGKMALARLDLHAGGNRMGLSLAMPQPRPFLPRCRGPADCLACGARLPALLGRHGGLLHGAERSARRSPARIGARHAAGRSRTNRRGSWLWHGRRVRVVDGSTITMPDTPENQAAYPQMKSQKPGCGFPIARILVIFSLSVGTVLEAAIGKYKGKQTGENSLFRELYYALAEGDVILADRYFSGWCDIALPVATRHRHGDPQAPTPAHGLSHGQAIGQGRPLGCLDPAAATEMDVGRTVRPAARRVDVARGSHSRRSKRLSHAVVGGGDDAVGCRALQAFSYLAAGANYPTNQ